MKNITCCLSILSGLLLQSCDITRMEPPAYKTDRASTRTYENLIFYEVLTDGIIGKTKIPSKTKTGYFIV